MAQRRQQDLLSRLADRGEQMVGRITDLPGAKQLVDRMAGLTKGLDDVQRKLRSLDPLERRVTQLERRLDKLEGAGSAKTTTRRTTARASSAKRSASGSSARASTTRKTPPRRRSSGSS
jgi:uncharacterized protein YoxC